MLNEKYSYKQFDYYKLSFKDVDPSEFNGTEIVGSCFYQPGSGMQDIFPSDLVDVTFIDCNLDNILVPFDCSVVRGSNQCIFVQNDLEDWICDEFNAPIDPMNKEWRMAHGISVLPSEIPSEQFTVEEHALFLTGISAADILKARN